MRDQKGFIKLLIIWIVIITLILGGIIIFFNLPSSLPGELIYPLKEISENIQLAAYELSYEGRAKIFTKLSNNRLDEFKTLVTERKNTDKIIITLKRLVLMQNKAIENIEQAHNRGTNITVVLFKLETSLKEQENVLQRLQPDVLEQYYEELLKAISSTQENLEKINGIINRV